MVAVSRCLLWSGLLWITPTPRVSSPPRREVLVHLQRELLAMRVQRDVDVGPRCLPSSRAPTRRRRWSVTGKSCVFTTSSRVSKMRRSSPYTPPSRRTPSSPRRAAASSTEPSFEMSPDGRFASRREGTGAIEARRAPRARAPRGALPRRIRARRRTRGSRMNARAWRFLRGAEGRREVRHE